MRSEHGKKALISDCYSFRCDRLRNGDILLCTDPDEKVSKAIRKATGGSFSHAAICTLAPIFMEANLPTVAEFSLDGRLLAKRERAKILRLKSSMSNALAIAESAARMAGQHQFGRYDLVGAIASRFGGFSNRVGVFCSFVVADAYAKAGLNIANKGAEATTPADIERSVFLDDVTDSVITPHKPNPYLAHFFVDRGPQFPEGSPEVDVKLMPAQLYNIALRKAGERVSDYLTRKGLPGVDGFVGAQGAMLRYESEPWFDELDAIFATAITELALPGIEKLPSFAELSRKIRDKELSIVINEGRIRSEVLAARISQLNHGIDRSLVILKQRSDHMDLLRQALAERKYKFVEAVLACETCLHELEFEALASQRIRLEWLRSYACDRGWSIDPSDAGPPR